MAKTPNKTPKTLMHWLYLEAGKQKRLDLQKELDVSSVTLYGYFRQPEKMKNHMQIALGVFFLKVYGLDFTTELGLKLTRREFAEKYLAKCSTSSQSKKAS